ncbi:MAG: hypothetical protein ABI693_19395 [Bryobacteraceae bacterium]
MTSEKQNEANRTNAQHSTGPKTENGKANSARNALSHGLTSKDLCVAPNQKEEFEAIQSAFHEDLDPTTAMEFALFNQIVSSHWRLLRCDRAEAALLDRLTDPNIDPLLQPDCEPQLRTIQRVRAQAARDFHKATAELRKLQTENQYRTATMDESDGCSTGGLGLADWQTLRTRIKRDRNLDAAHQSRIFADSIKSLEFDARAAAYGLMQNEPNLDQDA